MWWKQKGVSFKRGLRELKNDEDALELACVADSKKCEMEIYLEHGMSNEKNVLSVSVPLLTNNAQTENVEVNEDVVASEGLKDVNVNEEVPVDFNVDETVNVNEEVPDDVIGSEGLKDGEAFNVNDEVPVNVNVNEEVPVDVDNGQVYDEAEDDSDGSVDSMRGVHFDDSEEERALGADDGFNHADVGHAEAELNEKGETSGVDRDGGIEGSRGNVDGFTPANVQNMYIMDEEYESDELLSGAETSDGEARPKYPRCKQLGHNSRSCKSPPPVNEDDVTEDTAARTQQSQHVSAPGTQQSQYVSASSTQQSTQTRGKSRASTNTQQNKGKSKVASSSQQSKGKTKVGNNSQQSKGKSKMSQGTSRVTRSSQKSQQSGDTGAGSSRANTNKRKDGPAAKKGTTSVDKEGNQWKRGKKKSLPTGPVIPEFARHMSVGQLVTQLSQIWQHHIDIVKASALEQAAALAAEDASHPVTTSADQAHASTIPPAQPPQTPSAQAQAPAKKGKESGESSQRNDNTKG
ncbi:hypothetical protein SESBI_50076 [Sesbania bispinosa]|nr:hypothetical protein SESBI_50076 [Sesbania bispinosa]